MTTTLSVIQQFLKSKTSAAWIKYATSHQELLLIDHAHCEKKAASSALNLIYRYADKYPLLQKMSRLAREELRHFEQVLKILEKREIIFRNISPSKYAQSMHKHVSNHEPDRLIDHLIIGAIIEARSCERFAMIAPYLDEELGKFYISLLSSEGRHFEDYLHLAKRYAEKDIEERVQFFLSIEAGYINSEDEVFRFHSGIPSSKL